MTRLQDQIQAVIETLPGQAHDLSVEDQRALAYAENLIDTAADELIAAGQQAQREGASVARCLVLAAQVEHLLALTRLTAAYANG